MYLCNIYFPGGSMVRNLPAKREMQVQSLGQEDPLEMEMATLSSILAWETPWTEEPGGLQSVKSQRVRPNWACGTYVHATPGWQSLGGCRLWGCTQLDTTEVTSQHQTLRGTPGVSTIVHCGAGFPLFTVFLWEAGQSGPAVFGRQSRWSLRRVSDRSRTFTQVLLLVGGLQA